jgi:hypothetical protein
VSKTKEKLAPEEIPEVSTLLAMGSLMFKGVFEPQVQYSLLLRCYHFDPAPEKKHWVQECRKDDPIEMCFPCRTKFFLRCASQAFNQHANKRYEVLSGKS